MIDLEATILSCKGVTKSFPFGEEVAVYKVRNKIFALVADRNNHLTISLKCEPNDAMALRSMFPAVTPGYHLNKTHWNTVTLDGSIPDELIEDMIITSYDLIVKNLKRVDREKLNSDY